MRSARVVGLSADGRALIVATDNGEELTIPTDEKLRAAMRGDRPRLGQLEIEMENSLSPRDIQMRIRAGESLDDVARVAGLPMDRVERFAAPVLAERAHVAGQAMSASVRRKGETAAHRSLRITVTERLLGRGVDVDTVDWDSFRMEDGRWTVTADYRSGEASRHAEFRYDLQGRFSVAANDEARWLLGEHSATTGPQPGRRRPGLTGEDDTEPTLDLSDELALVRATQEPPADDEGDEPESSAAEPATEGADEPDTDESVEPTIAVRRTLRPVPDPEPEPEAEPDYEPYPEAEAEPAAEVETESEATDAPLGTGYGTLGGDGYAEESTVVYAGLSDATAIPDAPHVDGWEPAIVVNYPVEPSLLEESGPLTDPEHSVLPGTDEPGPPDPIVAGQDRGDEAEEFLIESDEPEPPKRPIKRKRASVPSWDEIMFGGPKRP